MNDRDYEYYVLESRPIDNTTTEYMILIVSLLILLTIKSMRLMKFNVVARRSITEPEYFKSVSRFFQTSRTISHSDETGPTIPSTCKFRPDRVGR